MKKSIFNFIRTTLTGGIIFLLPIVLLFIVLAKAIEILHKISSPLADAITDGDILGFDGSMVVAIVLLIIICFISGLLFRLPTIKLWVKSLEDNVLTYLPGYALMKAITVDTLGQQEEHNLKPILVQDGDSWNMAFLVEENKELSTVFIPDAPRYDAGEVRVVATSTVKKLNISTNKFIQSIKNFGKGVLEWKGMED